MVSASICWGAQAIVLSPVLNRFPYLSNAQGKNTQTNEGWLSPHFETSMMESDGVGNNIF